MLIFVDFSKYLGSMGIGEFWFSVVIIFVTLLKLTHYTFEIFVSNVIDLPKIPKLFFEIWDA